MSDSDVAAVRDWLDTVYKDFAASWKQRWNGSHGSPPDRLYHYTTPAGATGILTNRVIWASDARYLNDISELSYIHTVIATVAQELSEEFPHGPARTFLDAASDRLLEAFTGPYDIYVACFCSCGDLLSQWRSYAAGGLGYALGFEPEPMRTDTGLLLRRVTYDPAKQQELTREVLAFMASGLAALNAGATDYGPVAALIEAGGTLAEAAFCFKHPGFKEEQEWRLVLPVLKGQHPGDSEVQFRETEVGLMPYVEVRPNGHQPGIDALLAIREVVLGPTRHPDLAEVAARRLLESSGYGDSVVMRRSKIPLRV